MVARGAESFIIAWMKVRDSGMPERSYWENLFDLNLVLDRLGIDKKIGDVVEVGCGYGTFTLPVAQRIRGTLHAFDIEPDMIEITRKRAAAAKIGNVCLALGDVVAEGFGLPAASVDAALLFNILHAENPQDLLRAAAIHGLPLVAIGGITPENAGIAIAAGADLVAVVGGVFDAPDPLRAARALQALFS